MRLKLLFRSNSRVDGTVKGFNFEMQTWAIKALRQIEVSSVTGIWNAHHGCAVIAGALLIAEDLVTASAKRAIEGQLPLQLGLDMEGTPPEDSVDLRIFTEKIFGELAIGAMDPKEIGHDVIYVGYVLHALNVFHIQPWGSLLRALIDLICKIKRSGPGWITINGKREVRAMSAVESGAPSDYWRRFAGFDRPRAMEIGDMQLGHLLTHGHAIVRLNPLAPGTLLSKLDIGHRKRMYTLRETNAEEINLTPLQRRAVDPRDERYWLLFSRLGDMHGHAIKYAYSFLDLRRGSVTNDDLKSFGRIVWPGDVEW